MFEHVKQRALERLNLKLSDFDCQLLAKMVQQNDTEPLKNHWHAVKFKGRIFKICYTKGRIKTVLNIS